MAMVVTVLLLPSGAAAPAPSAMGVPDEGASAALPTASFPTAIQHVFVILEENEARSTVIAKAPFMASLASEYSSPVNFYAVCHPSAPNYLAITGGLTHQCGTDHYQVYSDTNLADLVTAKGLTWMDYQESMPTPCDTHSNALYDVSHNPFIYYSDVVKQSSLCDSHVVPLSDFNPSSTPANFVWVTPNMKDDGHQTDVVYADNWLKSWLTPLMSEPWFASSVFLIDFDEGAGSTVREGYSVGGITLGFCGHMTVCGGPVYLTAVSPLSKGVGEYTPDATQYSVLSTIEWLLGLGSTGTGYDGTSNFPAMTGLFK
jgi:phosphatidylinositol-3-phosphatase